MIVDAQSVKNTDSAEHKGYDAGKKVSRIKRPIAVDTQGLPHAIAITTADVTDRKGALAAMDRCASNLQSIQSVLVDGATRGALLRKPYKRSFRRRYRWSNATKRTPLSCCPSVGLWNAPSAGWKNAAAYGRTARVRLIPVCSSSIWRSLFCSLEDCEQALRKP
ncbi:putative transposase [Nitrococcus mobilis Nb-231]|uniref:Putative transposase n=1 Tax=Nitrococcus mobilis Nb-231 TaxID=314278 RepID=A4BV25_9GAMM|nr:putative transposase [Nitrococcus mobilis Nb-231]